MADFKDEFSPALVAALADELQRGPRGPRVFKFANPTLQAGTPHTVTRRHRFQPVSVRRLYPGPHRIEIQVNGRVLGGVDVELSAD